MDDGDEFNPEVSITAPTYAWDNPYILDEGIAYVTWYDRGDDPNNYFYRTKMARSKMGSFVGEPIDTVSTIISDPDYLPRHCERADVRFIGDFSAVQAAPLHTHGLFVTAQAPTVGTIANTEFQSYENFGR